MYVGFHVQYMFAADSPCSFAILNFRNSTDVKMYSKIFHTLFTSGVYLNYTGCHRRNGPNFGRVFLMLNYTDITQNTYIQS